MRGENAHGRPLADEEIRAAGIDRKGSRGEAGVMLGRFADEEIITALKNGFSLDDALRVVHFCPGDRDVQREGLRVMRGQPDETGAYNNPGSITEARRVMARFLEVKKMQAEYQGNGSQGDLFGELGFGGNLMDDEFNRFFGKYQTRRLKEISEERSFLNNLVGKKVSAAMAEKYGIDLNDVAGSLKKKLEQLSMDYERWKNPAQHADLMEEMRGAFREENAGQDWMDFGGTAAKEPVPEDGATAHFSVNKLAREKTFPLSPTSIVDGFRKLETLDIANSPNVHVPDSGVRDITYAAKKAIKNNRGKKCIFSTTEWKNYIKMQPSISDLAACSHLEAILDNAFDAASFISNEGNAVILRMSKCYIDEQAYNVMLLSHIKPTGDHFAALKVYKIENPESQEAHRISSFESSESQSLSHVRGEVSLDDLYDLVKSFSEKKQQYDKIYSHSVAKPSFDEWATLQTISAQKFMEGSNAKPEYGLPLVYYRGLKANAYKDKKLTVTWVAADIGVSMKHAQKPDGTLGYLDRYIVNAKKSLELPANRTQLIDGRTFFEKIKRNIGSELTEEDSKRLSQYGDDFDKHNNGIKVEAYNIWDGYANELVEIAQHYGYDSFLASEDGTWTLGLFSRSQVKSITRNIGSFNRAEMHAHFSLFSPAEASGLKALTSALRSEKGEGRFRSDTLGRDVMLAWGSAGRLRNPDNPDSKVVGASGLAHIIFTRMAHGETLDEACYTAAKAILAAVNGEINAADSSEFKKELRLDGYNTWVYLKWMQKDNAYVVTGYQENNKFTDADVRKRAMNLAKDYADEHSGGLTQLGAALERAIARVAREYKQNNADPARKLALYEPRSHFSLGGEKSAVFGEYDAQGLTYVDPADGKKKFCIDTRGVRLSNGFTPGELSSIAPGGHKDTSLKSMVAFPELWRAYPELGNMRVRLMRPKNGSPGYYGFYDPEGGAEGQYICVNVTAVLAAKNPVTELLDTLLHEAQHAIQAHEGHSNGAGSMGQKGAQRYLGRAIQQRKQLGLDDEWAKANYDFMNKLLARVNRGDKMAIESVYWLSHGEQEARFAGAGYGEGASEAGMNPMTSLARMRGVGVRPDAESWMTVPLSRDITELGGVTFGNAGSHAGVMQSRLVPVGDFYTDRKEFQIREAMTRRTRELNKLATHGERGSTDFLLEALQVANTAANVVPMAFWQKIMRMSFENQAEGLLTQGAIPRRELEFWLNDKEAMEMLDRASDIVNKERAAVEHDLAGERPDATDKEK